MNNNKLQIVFHKISLMVQKVKIILYRYYIRKKKGAEK